MKPVTPLGLRMITLRKEKIEKLRVERIRMSRERLRADSLFEQLNKACKELGYKISDLEREIRSIKATYHEGQHGILDFNDVWGGAGPDFRPKLQEAA